MLAAQVLQPIEIAAAAPRQPAGFVSSVAHYVRHQPGGKAATTTLTAAPQTSRGRCGQPAAR